MLIHIDYSQNESDIEQYLWSIDIPTLISSNSPQDIENSICQCIEYFHQSKGIQNRCLQLLQDVYIMSSDIYPGIS